jgi:hypothetical protein
MNTTLTGFEEINEERERPRKRSVPPVHIPLLDFSKLNQPRVSAAKKQSDVIAQAALS